jgi:hypothetical protein
MKRQILSQSKLTRLEIQEETDMPQSIHFRGYKVSGFAVKVDSGWSNAWYLIEKDG